MTFDVDQLMKKIQKEALKLGEKHVRAIAKNKVGGDIEITQEVSNDTQIRLRAKGSKKDLQSLKDKLSS